MKTKNYLFSGVLIGLALITIPLTLIGSTTYNDENNDVGRYQISTSYSSGEYIDYALEVILDTKTGKVISRERRKVKAYTYIKN